MQFGRLYIQNSDFAIGSFASCNRHDEGKRITLIQQSKFAFWFIGSSWIHKYSVFYQIAMYIAYHAAKITLRIGAAVSFGFILAGINIFFHWLFILKKVAVIYRIYFSILRAFDIRIEFDFGFKQNEERDKQTLAGIVEKNPNNLPLLKRLLKRMGGGMAMDMAMETEVPISAGQIVVTYEVNLIYSIH